MSEQISKLASPTESREEIAKYLKMDEKELYQMLAVNKYKTRSAFYGRYPTLEKGIPSQKDLQDSLADGKQILNDIFKECKTVICTEYKELGDNFKNIISLAALIAPILIGSPLIAGVSVTAIAVLIIKIGVKNLCRAQKK